MITQRHVYDYGRASPAGTSVNALDVVSWLLQAPKTSRSNREFELYPNSHVIYYLILSKPNTCKEN